MRTQMMNELRRIRRISSGVDLRHLHKDNGEWGVIKLENATNRWGE